ncbi:hypothetical protein LINPERPRIM_LOCUS13790 [Linum perenne]
MQAFIEEFNYPMPRNCGGGKTGVFVNGRELHEQDLECLSKRGLPTLEHMFYILEIDGRLYDMTLGESFMGLANLLQRKLPRHDCFFVLFCLFGSLLKLGSAGCLLYMF